MGSLTKGDGPLKSIMQRVKGNGVDPRTKQPVSKSQTSRPGMSNRRGRGGVPSSKKVGAARTPLS